MPKIRQDRTVDTTTTEHAQDAGGARALFGAGPFPTLKDTIKTLAPELLAEAAPTQDKHVKAAPPTLFAGEEEVTASSVRPREHSGQGLPSHALRAELCRSGRSRAYDAEDLEAMENEARLTKPDLDDELPIEVQVFEAEVEAEDKKDAFNDYFYDLIADQYKDNMEAFMAANGTREFARTEDLWHERYRFDAHKRADTDEGAERERFSSTDTSATEAAEAARRASDEAAARAAADRRAAESRAADEAYARRLAEDHR